ncbi:hypothetical protein FDP41_010904 [Naegleria fowleri]|uniref:Uncharacterized protein n=1 Tax=Naegleria fowleri TaxID=5763 RepID=A0A6A5CC50_NAEFO|nr:uncharacterized protein FDP41_010904 [Naegleria fowleri]KAF0982925.1 hypothetical protein FDP41_010904 [Naegleria fowleri]
MLESAKITQDQELKFKCNRFSVEQFSILLMGDKILNADLKPIARKPGQQLFALDCATIANCNGVCQICHNLKSNLDEIINEKASIIEKVKNGELPKPKQVLQNPLLMYELLNIVLPHVSINDQEKNIFQLFRNANHAYELNWKKEEKSVDEQSTKKPKCDHFVPPQYARPNLPSYKPFQETFFMKFILNQLRNYNRDPHHHEYSEEKKRFWLVTKYFCVNNSS